ncbi:MAG: LamG-like jellyroll fold domain-containing protein, partial [Bacteroidota bacterium]
MKNQFPLPLGTLFSIFLFCFSLQTTLGQDTIEVQAFTFASETRNGVFEFPDEPGQTYEKILMYYTMRCHDNAVGNGNVGCREWDYSCNTFITDSTRVDSTRQLHPSYVISNFSGEEFDYTTQASYTYYQYEQHEINYTSIFSETKASVGSGNTSLALGGEQLVAKNQYLFTATELSAAGLISGALTGLELDISEAGDALSFLRVRIKHSNKTSLDPNAPDLDGFTEVYFLNTPFEAPGLQRLNFYESFIWDGTSNLIVEYSYTNGENSNPIALKSHDTSFASGIFSNEKEHQLTFGANGGVAVPSNVFTEIEQQITLSFWAYGDPGILPVNTTVLEGSDLNNNRQVNVHLPWSNGQVYWDCGNDGSGYDRINKTANAADFAGRWSHWAFTKNAATGEMRIYLDGQLWHSGTGKNKLIDVRQFQLGQAVTFNNGYFGQVDELRIWNEALNEQTIQAWMNRPLDPSHPNYDALMAYFPLNEGAGLEVMDQSGNAQTAQIVGAPSWTQTRATALRRNFVASSLRPNLSFVQGSYDIDETLISVLDSVINTQHVVIAYTVNGTDLIAQDTTYVYPSGAMSIFDEAGNVIGTEEVPNEQTLSIEELVYFQKRPAKYEILSLVTPYGNGLSLGPDGKTFVFDLTDYTPILKGKKRLSIELGGEFQEELDIKFQFIKGTPPRDVLDIQNIWPFRRGWYAEILDDRYFEPRQMMIHPAGQAFKVRSTITGHGQNGEFVSQNHYLDLDGGFNEFNYDVWTECATIPIYPQGGTWLFDRAGWCPGQPSDIHQFDVSALVVPGEMTTFDYGLNGAQLSEANYLVSTQLVSYGAPNRSIDVAVQEIKRPSKRVEFARINPACNQPIVLIQNLGATELTSLSIEYGIQNGNSLTYEWTGSLAFLESEEVVLPVDDLNFWVGA